MATAGSSQNPFDEESDFDDVDDLQPPPAKRSRASKGKARASNGKGQESTAKASTAANDAGDDTSELTSSRKLQNRVAQREFRQRKLQYVKDLEARVAFLSSSKDDQLQSMRVMLRGILDENKHLRKLLQNVTAFIGDGIGGLTGKFGLEQYQGVDAFMEFVDRGDRATVVELYESWREEYKKQDLEGIDIPGPEMPIDSQPPGKSPAQDEDTVTGKYRKTTQADKASLSQSSPASAKPKRTASGETSSGEKSTRPCTENKSPAAASGLQGNTASQGPAHKRARKDTTSPSATTDTHASSSGEPPLQRNLGHSNGSDPSMSTTSGSAVQTPAQFTDLSTPASASYHRSDGSVHQQPHSSTHTQQLPGTTQSTYPFFPNYSHFFESAGHAPPMSNAFDFGYTGPTFLDSSFASSLESGKDASLAVNDGESMENYLNDAGPIYQPLFFEAGTHDTQPTANLETAYPSQFTQPHHSAYRGQGDIPSYATMAPWQGDASRQQGFHRNSQQHPGTSVPSAAVMPEFLTGNPPLQSADPRGLPDNASNHQASSGHGHGHALSGEPQRNYRAPANSGSLQPAMAPSAAHSGNSNGFSAESYMQTHPLLAAVQIITFHLRQKEHDPNHIMPPALERTAVQDSVPHDPRLDGVLSKEWRSKLISCQNYNVHEFLADIREAATVHSSTDLLDPSSWEMSEPFLLKYKHTLTEDVVTATNHWRKLRGEPDVAI